MFVLQWRFSPQMGELLGGQGVPENFKELMNDMPPNVTLHVPGGAVSPDVCRGEQCALCVLT